jgi:hypothetical protein
LQFQRFRYRERERERDREREREREREISTSTYLKMTFVKKKFAKKYMIGIKKRINIGKMRTPSMVFVIYCETLEMGLKGHGAIIGKEIYIHVKCMLQSYDYGTMQSVDYPHYKKRLSFTICK